MKRSLFYVLAGLAVATVVALVPEIAFAASACSEETLGILPTCVCTGQGPCQMVDFMAMVIEIANWMVGVVSALSVTALVVAGFMLMTSGGNAQRRQKAMEWIKSVLVGAGFALGAWILINTLILGLKGTTNDSTILGQEWYEVRNSNEQCVTNSDYQGYDCYNTAWFEQTHLKEGTGVCAADGNNLCDGRGRTCCKILPTNP